MTLSIFFPCYNDVYTIEGLVSEAECVAEELADDYEIIVVDDGSEDGCRELLKELERLHPKLEVVFHEKNRGYGGALRSGFSKSKMEFVFYTDGDGQYRPKELKSLWKLMVPGVDVVNGYKANRSDPLHRILAGKLYLAVVRLMFGIKVRDVDCDFRLIRKRALSRVTLTQDSGLICVELVKRMELAGYAIVESEVSHHPRRHGRSQFFRPRHILITCMGLIGLWWELVVRRDSPTRKGYVPSPRRES
jgi:glycosyltransferase involved in cell wall biosynthesis